MAKPILHGPAISTFVRTVRLALEEKSVDYEFREVNILKGEHQEAEFLRLNPFGKVPAFEHDGLTLFETDAICRYVDEAFPGPSLQPEGVRERARMVQVTGIVNSFAYPSIITGIVIQRVVVPLMGGTSDEQAILASLDLAETSLATLDGFVGAKGFLAGDGLSLADLAFVPIYDYLRAVPEAEKLLPSKVQLARWWSGIENRDSLRKTRPTLG